MKNNNSLLPQDLYDAHLRNINKIKFTHREIDIIAYLLSGKSAKTIASCLSISPKTIESHVHNIMVKFDCNSRDGIISLIEKSDKIDPLKTYYQSLLIESAFKKQLEKLSRQLSQLTFKESICLVYWADSDAKHSLFRFLEDHLKQMGIQVLVNLREVHHPQGESSQNSSVAYTLFIFSETLIKELGIGKKPVDLSQFIRGINKISGTPLIILPDKALDPEIYAQFDKITCIDFSEGISYYSGAFEVLRKVFPTVHFDDSVAEFKEQYQLLCGFSAREKPPESVFLHYTHHIKRIGFHLRSLIKERRFFFGFTVMSLSLFCLWAFTSFRTEDLNPHQNQMESEYLRSDLIIPTETILLNRPQLLKTIEESLKRAPQEIKTIALVGIGGAGKTTLARYYARHQKASLIAEVNAETKESLSDSFESLAQILATTEKEKKNLRKIQDIEFVKERDKQILFFVKEKLKETPNWLLLYDNVKQFKDIHEYFPYDSGAWGSGRIIVITRDKNIQNNSYISSMIEVTELSAQEKLDLFVKIMSNGKPEQYTSQQKEKARAFLQHIPPFPLDVSIAAYYLKTTNVSYEKYLDHIKIPHKDFTAIQENVIKEATDYTKTRYGIITLSLDNLIEADSDFASLLLFISLLNDQNIPIDLLNTYKNDIIVDNFIYHLKKYSLITRESTSPVILSPLFSIHPSTQEVSLDYLQKKLGLKNNHAILTSIIKTMGNYIDEALNKEDTLKMKFLAAHCERIINHPFLDLEMRGILQGKLGHIYYYLNNYGKAKDFLEKTLSELKEQKNNDSEKTAETLMYLGDVYSVLCDYKKARKLSEESLEIYQKHFSKDHLGTAKALAHLGNVYRRLGDYEKAKTLCEQSLEIYQSHYSENPIKVAWVIAHLGLAHKELGNYDKARGLLEESFRIYQKESSDNHLREAWILAHMGSIYREQGDFQKAKGLLEKSLAIYKRHFSESHIRTAWVLFLLGEVYKDLKDYRKAETLLKKSLLIYEENYEKNHTETTKILTQLGEVYLLQGQTNRGEELLSTALKISSESQHPWRYFSLEVLADLYLKKSVQALKEGHEKEAQQLKQKAIDYLNQACHIIGKCLSKESPQIKRIQLKLANIDITKPKEDL